MAKSGLGPGGYSLARDGTYSTTFTKTVQVTFEPYLYVNTSSGLIQRSRMQYIPILDGATAPAALSGYAFLYIDESTGALSVLYSTGTTRTVASAPS